MSELDEALRVVRAAGYTVLEGGAETVTQWAVQAYDLGEDAMGVEECTTEAVARMVLALRYRDRKRFGSAQVVSRTVPTGPWVEVPPELPPGHYPDMSCGCEESD